MAGFYAFVRGIPGKLGVGVADQGALQSSTLPINSIVSPSMMVQRSFLATKPAYGKFAQIVPDRSPLGTTGSFMHGVPILGRLAKGKG